jgi:hypothetical protein
MLKMEEIMIGLEPAQRETYLVILREVGERLAATEWYKDGWQFITTGLDGFATCQLFRPDWLIQPNRPIHFESFIGANQLNSGELPVALHAHPTFEQHSRFAQLFLERAAHLLEQLPGYTLADSTRPGFNLVMTKLPFSAANLADVLVAEFTRLHQIGPLIDQSLAELSS